jgi:hypothetical protein
VVYKQGHDAASPYLMMCACNQVSHLFFNYFRRETMEHSDCLAFFSMACRLKISPPTLVMPYLRYASQFLTIQMGQKAIVHMIDQEGKRKAVVISLKFWNFTQTVLNHESGISLIGHILYSHCQECYFPESLLFIHAPRVSINDI